MSEWITNRLPTEADGPRVIVSDENGVFTRAVEYVEDDQPWMPCPPPYVAPKPEPDTSLAASIEREEKRINYNSSQWKCESGLPACCCSPCDAGRIIEAARRVPGLENEIDRISTLYAHAKPKADKWDAAEKQLVEWSESFGIEETDSNDPDNCKGGVRDCPIDHDVDNGVCVKPVPDVFHMNNDPDGVGEGWRSLKLGETIQADDELRSDEDVTQWRKVRDVVGRVVRYENNGFRRRIEPLVAASPAVSHVVGGQAETQPRERNDEPQGKPREWWVDDVEIWGIRRAMVKKPLLVDCHRVREVNAAMDAWTAKLIELCESLERYNNFPDLRRINDHMKARPQ